MPTKNTAKTTKRVVHPKRLKDRVLKMYAKGTIYRVIIEKTGVTATTIKRWANAAGLPDRPPGRPRTT